MVVLPAPCRPASRITAGGCVARSSGAAAPPISAASSRCTTPTSACPGVSEPTTSAPERLLAHRGDEVLDDRQRDVGLEQREANFAQRILDVGFGEPRFAAQLLHDAAEPLGQVVEHRGIGSEAVQIGAGRARRRCRTG